MKRTAREEKEFFETLPSEKRAFLKDFRNAKLQKAIFSNERRKKEKTIQDLTKKQLRAKLVLVRCDLNGSY